MKLAIVALLLAVAMAGRASRFNRISIVPGNRYDWDFTCGYNYGGVPTVWTADTFTYNFIGLPDWCSWSGSKVWGVAPAGISGNFPFRVSWNGRESGESWFTLSVQNAAVPSSAAWVNSWYYCEPINTNSWRVYLPFFTSTPSWSIP